MENKEQFDELIKLHTENLALIGKALEKFSVHGEESILLCLYKENKSVFAGDFKDKTGLTSGRIAIILKQLEAKGYIVREQDKNDKRKTLVTLTDEGKTHIEVEISRTSKVHKKLLAYLGETDSAEYIRLINKVIEFVEENEADFKFR